METLIELKEKPDYAKAEELLKSSNTKEYIDNELEKIGFRTLEKEAEIQKEAFAQATQEEKINMLAARTGLK